MTPRPRHTGGGTAAKGTGARKSTKTTKSAPKATGKSGRSAGSPAEKRDAEKESAFWDD